MVAAALAFAGLMGALALFQLLLVSGAPFGRLAWGGQHDVLPRSMRIGSALSIVLYGLFTIIVLDAAGLLSVVPDTWADDLIWVLAAYFGLGVLINAASRSLPERVVMTGVSLLLAVLCTIVAVISGASV